jgi:predicted enzyme related to lactoylglutathione lyase
MNKPSGFIWYELLTNDVDAAARFYGDVVGWGSRDSGTPGMDYRMWSIDGEMIGGLMAIPAPAKGMPPMWAGYLNVEDVDASVARIKAAGGATMMPPTDIPGVGRIAMVADPQGASFYVMTPIGEGMSTSFAPGRRGHAQWNELHTTDWEAALAFYAREFGWSKSSIFDMGAMGSYLLLNNGGAPIGGMFNSPAPKPMWLPYFNVEGVDAAKARVEAAGGKIDIGPVQVPDQTWIIQGRDPQGAIFALVSGAR